MSDSAMRSWIPLLIAVLFVCHAGNPAVAAEIELERTDVTSLSIEAGVSIALYAGTFFMSAPKDCIWCMPSSFDSGIRNALRVAEPATAGTASDVLVMGVLPVAGLGVAALPALLGGRYGEAAENSVMLMDAVAVTMAINQVTKNLVARRRPAFVYGLESEADLPDSEEAVSFFSGHTSFAFSIAAAATTIGFLRDARWAPWAAGGLGVAAMAGGVLRIAADAHWASDVLTGMALGTGVGILMPLLLHGRKETEPTETSTIALVTTPATVSVFLTW